jgi:SAM-dependent methyltransferase
VINDRVAAGGAYYQELRLPMLSLVRGTPKRILEIGCATGQTLAYMRDRGAEYMVGVEHSAEAAALAEERGVGRIIRGDVERMKLDLESCSFDLLIAGHVLEHLADPWTVLRRLRRLLKTGGQVVGALPNVRHHSVVLPLLLKGEWEYRPSGVMDWTHLRFFSRRSTLGLLESTGFQVEQIVPEFGGPRSRIANSLTGNIFGNFLSYAYNFSALKTTPDGALSAEG